MKLAFTAIVCGTALTIAGCSKQPKEISKAAESEAAMLVEEAKFAMSIREFTRAEELVNRALKLNEQKPEYWVTLGMSLRRQNNTSGARKAYEKALAVSKARYKADNRPEEIAQQAFVLGLLGRTDEALKVLEKGLQDHPDSIGLKRQADPRGFLRTFKTPEFKELAL